MNSCRMHNLTVDVRILKLNWMATGMMCIRRKSRRKKSKGRGRIKGWGERIGDGISGSDG